MEVPGILHVDMDAFFAAIEQLDHPEWRGRPVIVGAPPDRRGVVSTASYEARVFGVRSAMPSRTAGKLCPDGVFVPVRMARYREVSRALMELFESYTPDVEPVSIDEAFLDVRGALHRWQSAAALARDLKQRIRAQLSLTASVGVARNKFLAKLASDMEKPDGLTVVPVAEEDIAAFLSPLPLSRVAGVGRVTARHLEQLGLHTIGDVQQADPDYLRAKLRENRANALLALAFGRDDRPVTTERETKSISAEHTFTIDCDDEEPLVQTLLEQAEDVGRRLRASGLRGKTGTLKLRYADFTTITRQQSLGAPSASDRDLCRCAVSLLRKHRQPQAVRLIGFGVSGLTEADRVVAQPDLFAEWDESAVREKQERLDRVVDRLRAQYGRQAIRRGGG